MEISDRTLEWLTVFAYLSLAAVAIWGALFAGRSPRD